MICLCSFPAVHRVHAEAPPTGTLTAVPADGKPRGIQLRAQTVDATIRQAPDGVWADTVLWVKLFNPGKQPIVVPVALGGPQLGTRALPQIQDVSLNDRPVKLDVLRPLTAREDGAVIGLSLPITVPLMGSAAVRIRYSQKLEEQEGLVTFSYPMTATARWSGTPESLRLTLKLAPLALADGVLSHAPPARRNERDGFTWHWDGQRPQTSIGVAFMSPRWWDQFRAAQIAASAEAAGSAAHVALSRLFRHLAGLPSPVFDGSASFYDRYLPAEVGELGAALAAPEQGAPAERAAIHLRLGEIFLAHASRLGEPAGGAYHQMAAAELETAIALDGADAAVRAATSDLFVGLAGAAQERGDRMTAEQHLARVAALNATTGTASPETLAQAATLVRATEAIESGDLSTARHLITAAFGAEAATLADAPPPRATLAAVTVTTSPSERTFSLRLTGRDAAAVAALLANAASALSARPLASVVAAGDQISITVPFTSSRELTLAQTDLAAALPHDPELALLAAALSPRRLTWETKPGLLASSGRYVEHIDLGPAWQAWQTRASRLEDASRDESAAQPENERLVRLQRAFWAADAAAWRKLAAESRGEYAVAMAGAVTGARWEAPAGAARVLEAEIYQSAPTQTVLIAGIAVCLVAFLALAVLLLV